ncbi:MAG: hypothetical protein ACI9HK_003824 [Pirellulaceae bacterium]|jgi:hypothetical protein
MDDQSGDNPYKAPESPPLQRPRSRPSSIWGAGREGAFLGFKWTSLIIGSLAALMLIVTLIAMAAMYIGYWWQGYDVPAHVSGGLLEFILTPLIVYIVSCIWGIGIGIIISVTVYGARKLFGN